MWIFLNDAFLSIVQHRGRPGHLMVRARVEGDIERVFGEGVRVITTPAPADYRFRVTLERGEVVAAMERCVQAIDYPDFKSSVAEHDRHHAYFGAWSSMQRLQSQREAGPDPTPDLFAGDGLTLTACEQCGMDFLAREDDAGVCPDCQPYLS